MVCGREVFVKWVIGREGVRTDAARLCSMSFKELREMADLPLV